MATTYEKFTCLNPNCWFSTAGRKAEWKIYKTANHIKFECCSCGFIVRIPYLCQTCGARHGISGELKGSTAAYGPGDFICSTNITEVEI